MCFISLPTYCTVYYDNGFGIRMFSVAFAGVYKGGGVRHYLI